MTLHLENDSCLALRHVPPPPLQERCAGEVQRLEEELLLLEDELQRRTTPTQPITDDQLETAMSVWAFMQLSSGQLRGVLKTA